MDNNRHIFALYLENVHQSIAHTTCGKSFIVQDKQLCSRALVVLRLAIGDRLILFDGQAHVLLSIQRVDAKKNLIEGVLDEITFNRALQPAITLFQCLTQKTAFEEIVYTATQMGVTRLVPVISEKVQRKWGDERDIERLHKIMIAAAEQSKSFVLPVIEKPVKLRDVVGDGVSHNLFFSPDGEPLRNLLHAMQTTKPTKMNILIGSEGGLTDKEEQLLLDACWKSYALTPTILRSVDAVVVGLGSIRSVVN